MRVISIVTNANAFISNKTSQTVAEYFTDVTFYNTAKLMKDCENHATFPHTRMLQLIVLVANQLEFLF